MDNPESISAAAQKIAEELTNEIISDLEQMKDTLLGDDSGLETTWDEVCVQIQGEASIFWDAYEHTVRAVIGQHIAKLGKFSLAAIWFQTEAGVSWSGEHVGRYEACTLSRKDVVDYLAAQYVFPAAARWSNPRIVLYLEQQRAVEAESRADAESQPAPAPVANHSPGQKTAPTLGDAIELALRAHAKQVDKVGMPYVLHPLRVMQRVKDEKAKIVAVLHDVVEDTPNTLKDLEGMGYPPEIVQAIEGVTKREGESYEQFVERAAANPLSRMVKMADLEDNMDIRRLPELTDKDVLRLCRYLKAWQALQSSCSCCLMKKKELSLEDLRQLKHVDTLIDSSHFSLSLMVCPECRQMYLHCSIEILDWEEGDDDDWSFYTPVTDQEADMVRLEDSIARAIVDSRRHITIHPDGHVFWTDQPEVAFLVGPG